MRYPDTMIPKDGWLRDDQVGDRETLISARIDVAAPRLTERVRGRGRYLQGLKCTDVRWLCRQIELQAWPDTTETREERTARKFCDHDWQDVTQYDAHDIPILQIFACSKEGCGNVKEGMRLR